MTKFGDYLLENCVQEWSKKYVNYAELRSRIKAISKAQAGKEIAPPQRGVVSVDPIPAPISTRKRKESVLEMFKPTDTDFVPFALVGVGEPQAHDQLKINSAVSIVHQDSCPNTPSFGATEAQIEMQLLARGTSVLDMQRNAQELGDDILQLDPASVSEAVLQSCQSQVIDTSRSFVDLIPSYALPRDEEVAFFSELHRQFANVNRFYEIKERYFQGQINNLIMYVNARRHEASQQSHALGDVIAHNILHGFEESEMKYKLRLAFKELYRGLDLLCNFRLLNYAAFVKILKKHDKISLWSTSSEVLLPRIVRAPFFASPLLRELLNRCEDVYTLHLSNGDRHMAMEELRVQPDAISPLVLFSLGSSFGISILLFLMFLLVLTLNTEVTMQYKFYAAFPIFRCYALLILCVWLWGVNVFVFHRCRVNHIFILEADPRTSLTHVQIWQYAAAFTVMYLMSLVSYLLIVSYGDEWGIHVFHTDYLHCGFTVLFMICLLCPFDFFCRSTRIYMLTTLMSIFVAPFRFVTFRDFFVGDQLCSLIKVFLDMNFAVCFYAVGSYLTHDPSQCNEISNQSRWYIVFLPFVWRMLQCFRRFRDTGDANHLMNALKYASTLVTTFINLLASSFDSTALLAMWAFSAFASSGFSLYWDIYRDWGLGDKEHMWLRANLLHSPIVYYWAIASNAVMRVVWIVTISPNSFGINISPPFLTMLVAAIEIFRRFQWNIFRIEDEFLKNCGKGRAINVVSIPDALAGGDDAISPGPAPVALSSDEPDELSSMHPSLAMTRTDSAASAREQMEADSIDNFAPLKAVAAPLEIVVVPLSAAEVLNS